MKSVFISEYKNLKDFSLAFDGDSFIYVFVGKNGSGKSNLFEALIEIFRHVYEYDKTKDDRGFAYTMLGGRYFQAQKQSVFALSMARKTKELHISICRLLEYTDVKKEDFLCL